jgi:hypothetical protein
MNWISKYKIEKADDVTVITGAFSASGGSFRIENEGDGGNADTTTVTLWGGQYDFEPTQFTITGAWEIREVIEMFKLLDNTI